MTIKSSYKNQSSGKHCVPCEGKTEPLSTEKIEQSLKSLDSWTYLNGEISKAFTFKNYYETTAFVNAVVWVAHRENHHPDIDFGYRTCKVTYKTHSVHGLTENDFICATLVDELLEGYNESSETAKSK